MARKARELTVKSYLSINGRGGPYKPVEEYTDEEIQWALEKICEKVGRFLSDYYYEHPELIVPHLAHRHPEIFGDIDSE